MLTKKQIAEVVEFDLRARLRGVYDTRRYGTASDDALRFKNSAHVRAADPYGGMPAPSWSEERTEEPANLPRKTLRYNYVVPARTRKGGWKAREAKIYHVAVRLNKVFKPVVKVVAVFDPATRKVRGRDLGYHQLAGWIVYWDRSDYENKSLQAVICPPALDEWFEDTVKWGGGLAFPWHETVNPSALQETRYRYSRYEDGHGVGVCDWLSLVRREPMVELLAKAGLRHLATPYAIRSLHRPGAVAWLRANAASARKAGVKDVVWAMAHGVSVDYAVRVSQLRDLVASRRRPYWIKNQVKPKIDFPRVLKTLPKWGVTRAEYVRYLEECEGAGLDLRNEGTLYPPVSGGREAFMDRLERLEAEAVRLQAAEERRRKAARRRELRAERRRERIEAAEEAKRFAHILADRTAELAAFQDSANGVAVLEGTGYTCVVAKSQEELLLEGRKMGNCVGCGSYGRAILAGDAVIVMVRDAEGRPFCDVEIDRKRWTVRQCYAKRNSEAPDEVRRLAEGVARALKARHRSDLKGKLYPTLRKRPRKGAA